MFNKFKKSWIVSGAILIVLIACILLVFSKINWLSSNSDIEPVMMVNNQNLSWKELIMGGDFSMLLPEGGYSAEILTDEYQDKEWLCIFTDIDKDGNDDLFLKAPNGVGIFHEQDGQVSCWFWKIFDGKQHKAQMDAFLLKNGEFLLQYYGLEEYPNFDSFTERYQLSESERAVLQGRLVDTYTGPDDPDGYSEIGNYTYTIDQKEIGIDEYREIMEEWFKDGIYLEEYSPAAGTYEPMRQTIEKYLDEYFRAIEDGDISKVKELVHDLKEDQLYVYELLYQYGLQSIEDTEIQTYPLEGYGNYWHLLISYRIRMKDSDKCLPITENLMIARTGDGHWQVSLTNKLSLDRLASISYQKERTEIKERVDRSSLEMCEVLSKDAELDRILSEIQKLYYEYIKADTITESETDFTDPFEEEFGTEWYPLETDLENNYFKRMFRPETYTVIEGDSLWGIASERMGDGKRYLEIVDQNDDQIDDPDWIFPEQKLSVGQKFYLANYYQDSMSNGRYAFFFPDDWVFGANEYSSLMIYSPSGLEKVYCNVQDIEAGTDSLLYQWDEIEAKINKYVGEHFADSVRDLQFEQYVLDDGELFIYSFVMDIKVENNDNMDWKVPFQVSVAVKRTDTFQAEFIGTGYGNTQSEITGLIRYMGAGFQESDGEEEDYLYHDYDFELEPRYHWELHDLFNPFDWLDSYYK